MKLRINKKIKTRDKTGRQTFGGSSFPRLHGHTRITLHDVNTGEDEVLEKDNLVTNAVANIYASNFFGAMDYSKLTPLRDMFGGVLCFEDTLAESADNITPPCETDNRLIAHSGQTPHSSASSTRGNPNGALSEVVPGGFKFTWDFATNQGNGTISAVSLCHKWGGDIGLKPIAAETGESLIRFITNKTKTAVVNTSEDHVDFSTYYNAVISADLANETGLHVYLDGATTSNSLIVSEVKLRTLKQDINGELGQADLIEAHTVTLTRTFDKRYTAICTDGDYIYVIAPNSNGGNTLYIDKVSLSTWTATDISISDASLSLAANNRGGYSNNNPYPNRVVVSDDYVYWPKSGNLTFYKINLTTPADITELTSTLESQIDEVFGQVAISDGLILGANYIINGSNVYPVTLASREFVTTSYAAVIAEAPQRLINCGDKYLAWAYGYDSTYPFTIYFGDGLPTCYIATIQNLDNAVTKTSDKTMQIEYTITIAEPEP